MKAKISERTVKDSDSTVTDQSLFTKCLLKNADTGNLVLGQKDGIKKTGRAMIENNEKLSLYEYNILRSILSYQFDNDALHDRKIVLTASQIYRKMRHGKGRENVSVKQQEEVHQAMMRLTRWVSYWLNDEAAEWLGIGDRVLKHSQILQFSYDEGYVSGNKANYCYEIYNIGLLHQIALMAGQLERMPQEVLSIKTFEKDKWKNWNLTKQRINIRTSLELFCVQYRRSIDKVSNKKTYDRIFEECEIGEHRETRRRAKEDVKVILSYWKHLGFIKNWKEYGHGRGVQITCEICET